MKRNKSKTVGKKRKRHGAEIPAGFRSGAFRDDCNPTGVPVRFLQFVWEGAWVIVFLARDACVTLSAVAGLSEHCPSFGRQPGSLPCSEAHFKSHQRRS
jgi:hypothetical protein